MDRHQLWHAMQTADFPSTFKFCNTPEGYMFGVGKTVPSTAAGWGPNAIFLHSDGSTAARVYVNKGTITTSVFTELESIDMSDAGSHFAATDLNGMLQELGQHIHSAQKCIPIPLTCLREASSMDVGNIAANGGVLASDTTPVLEAINAAGPDGCQRLNWAAGNTDQVLFSIPLPVELDTTSSIVLHVRIASAGTTDAVGFSVDSWFNEGDTKVTDTTGTNQTTSYAEKTADIAASDVPTGAQTWSCGLTPVAHGNDAMYLTAVWAEYTAVTLIS